MIPFVDHSEDVRGRLLSGAVAGPAMTIAAAGSPGGEPGPDAAAAACCIWPGRLSRPGEYFKLLEISSKKGYVSPDQNRKGES